MYQVIRSRYLHNIPFLPQNWPQFRFVRHGGGDRGGFVGPVDSLSCRAIGSSQHAEIGSVRFFRFELPVQRLKRHADFEISVPVSRQSYLLADMFASCALTPLIESAIPLDGIPENRRSKLPVSDAGRVQFLRSTHRDPVDRVRSSCSVRCRRCP